MLLIGILSKEVLGILLSIMESIGIAIINKSHTKNMSGTWYEYVSPWPTLPSLPSRVFVTISTLGFQVATIIQSYLPHLHFLFNPFLNPNYSTYYVILSLGLVQKLYFTYVPLSLTDILLARLCLSTPQAYMSHTINMCHLRLVMHTRRLFFH